MQVCFINSWLVVCAICFILRPKFTTWVIDLVTLDNDASFNQHFCLCADLPKPKHTNNGVMT